MTSNIGAGTISKNVALGFGTGDESGLSYEDMKERIMGELKKVFRPELLNRIDEVIVFHKLTKEEILEIVELMMRRVREQISTHEVGDRALRRRQGAARREGLRPDDGRPPAAARDPAIHRGPARRLRTRLSSSSPASRSSSTARSESDEEVSITLAGGRKREKVAVPAEPDDDAPEDEPVDEPAE